MPRERTVRAFGGLILAAGLAVVAASPSQAVTVSISPDKLLNLATATVVPSYPAASLAAKRQGLVAASVVVGVAGQIEVFDLLQSPDPEMGAATRRAVDQWRFKAVMTAPDQRSARVRSKMFFYFVITDGRPAVLTPMEMARARGSGEPGPDPGDAGGSFPTMSEADWLRDERSNPPPVLLDVRNRPAFEREHAPGAVNIPENELSIRALAELPSAGRIVIDCRADTGDLCGYAARILRRRGFTDVRLLTH